MTCTYDDDYKDMPTQELLGLLRSYVDPLAAEVLHEVERRLSGPAPTQTTADDIEHVRATLQAQIDVIVDDRLGAYRDGDFRTRMRQARGER